MSDGLRADPPQGTDEACSAENAETREVQVCDDCERPFGVWFAPNEVWNAVVDLRARMLCPVCFMDRADDTKFDTTGWLLVPEPWDEQTRLSLGLKVDGLGSGATAAQGDARDQRCSELPTSARAVSMDAPHVGGGAAFAGGSPAHSAYHVAAARVSTDPPSSALLSELLGEPCAVPVGDTPPNESDLGDDGTSSVAEDDQS